MRKAVTEHSIVAARLSGQVFTEQATREGGLAAYQDIPPALQAAVKAANPQKVVNAITTLSAVNPSKASALLALALKANPSIAASIAVPAVAAVSAQVAAQIVRDALTAAPSQTTAIAPPSPHKQPHQVRKAPLSPQSTRPPVEVPKVVKGPVAAALQSRPARTDQPHLRR